MNGGHGWQALALFECVQQGDSPLRFQVPAGSLLVGIHSQAEPHTAALPAVLPCTPLPHCLLCARTLAVICCVVCGVRPWQQHTITTDSGLMVQAELWAHPS